METKMDNGIPIFPAGVLKIYQNPNPPIIPDIDDFDYTNTGTNNSILIFGCDDEDCSDSNGVITPGDVIGVFYDLETKHAF